MKNLKSFIFGLLAVAACAGFTACQDDIDAPDSATEIPVAEHKANISILDLKKAFWQDDKNYCVPIPEKDEATGEHYYISGRVISSDYEGNVFRSISIQDETAAISFSVYTYNLYMEYRYGQEIVVDVTGMHIGKYNGLMQIGYPEWYDRDQCWETSFMSPEAFNPAVELNGLPEPDKIEIAAFSDFGSIPNSSPEDLMTWQSRIVRVNNVQFVPQVYTTTGATITTFGIYEVSNFNQKAIDRNGNEMIIRTSGYSNFWNVEMPNEKGDIVALLGFYGGAWQMSFNDLTQGLQNFGNPTLPLGDKENPWSVDQAIDLETIGSTPQGWVEGVIVGTVAPEVEEVTSNNDIDWGAEATMNNTVVIAPDVETRDIAKCLVISLPQGSVMREAVALANHPENFGKKLAVLGTLDRNMGTFGVIGNNGSSSQFLLDGEEVGGGDTPGDAIPEGDGSAAKPYNPSQLLAKGAPAAAVANTYVKGYIVGYIPDKYLDGATFEAPATVATNILIATSADVKESSKVVPVQLPAGTVRSALNLMDHPENLGKVVTLCGSFEKYFGTAGLKAVTSFELEGGDTPTPPAPVDPVTSIDQNFDANTNIPTGWQNIQIQGTKAWYVTTFNNNNYAAMTGYKGTAPFDSWLLTPPVDLAKMENKVLTFDTQVNGYASTTTVFEVYVLSSDDVATATRTKLNCTLATPPASGYSSWVGSGNVDLSSFSGTVYIGFRYYATSDANYATWCVDNVKLNAGGGGGGDTPTPPTPPAGEFKGDFNSFNDGQPKASPYGTYTNATGWTAENSIILGGLSSGEDSNPRFSFIGDDATLAPTINGNTSKVGKITSPALTGGCKTLKFKYGFAFSGKKYSFTVNVLQNGAVVKTDTVNVDEPVQKQAYEYSLDVNVSGDFSIEIVNNCPTAQAKNADRVSIWNLTWD